jgi:hypothetical protein
VSEGNGSMTEAFARIEDAEDDARDLRRLFLEFRREVREELRHIKEIGKHNSAALDYLVSAERDREGKDG